ncbi:MAG TPA: thymidine phosphorylase [Geminicoccus sp.]|jgi:thymidine phosphorylase|uniref:thymidine phosphorylase n=1 Tax=Geminicoccus sp. TaxID=2024832 RepID=UPI002E2F1784|nr:thymidine phosphorylase [Geminicoccus sp.]HEX2525518.1 thymidine phosphorylase [Geminicoccus sp.]
MLPQEVIRAKRDGLRLSDEAIDAFAHGLVDDSWSEGQIAALAMAILLRGMDRHETARLTRAMADSGDRLVWTDLPGPVVDKHSTGGIGDKVSLILAPILAACGCFVPMLSGRGLGHTGGTLDKLDAIPGYRSAAALEQVRRAVREAGCAIVGQTGELAPADRRLYAIRDVTATVESIPLVTASILSKKLAAGPEWLVMDVKVGSGAFMTDYDAARSLAQSIVEVANEAGLPTRALVTDMNMCLGHSAGNALEVMEAVDILRGKRTADRLVELSLALATELLDMAGTGHGRATALAALEGGAAAEHFARMVAALGGPTDLIDRPHAHLPIAPVVRPVRAGERGHVQAMDARALGIAIIHLGGGRRHPGSMIRHDVGLTDLCEVGAPVEADTLLGVVHAGDEAAADRAVADVRMAFSIGPDRPVRQPLIVDRLA